MTPGTPLAVLAAFAGATLLTQAMRASAQRRGVLDVPNARSSHGVPTPRGGGAAVVVVTTAGAMVGWLSGTLGSALALALGAGGLMVALVGFADDRRSLSAAARLGVHIAAALGALLWLGGLPPLAVGARLVTFGGWGYVLGTLGIVWTLNLFNFMDGIDGIAASEAVFVAVSGAALSVISRAAPDITFIALVFAAACGGFLLWNWPPARIFLGDVGSGYLGYVIAVLAVAATADHPAALWSWLILGGAFFVDATVTLVRRTLRGERVHEAHRSHAYQWLARRWASHRRVTLAVLLVDVLWLLPCAAFAMLHPPYAALTALLAFAPLVALAIAAGAGRREHVPPGCGSS